MMTAILIAYFIYLFFGLNAKCKLCRIEYLLNHSAAKPFQYRMLIPWLAKGLEALVSFLYLLFGLRQAVVVLNSVALFLTVYAFRYFLSFFFDKKKTSIALSLFYILPFYYVLARELPLWYPWDMPAILFFLLGIICIYKQKPLLCGCYIGS